MVDQGHVHYRWYYSDDIEMAGSVLPHYGEVDKSDELMAQMKKVFFDRQISRLYVVGSNDTTAPVLEDSYRRFLACLNEHLKHHPFLMGRRPGSADYAPAIDRGLEEVQLEVEGKTWCRKTFSAAC